ncbi:MAG TPA: DNA methyltransferase [Patescibacteria group bacterium]|nr:DNA methyltransferase [Patescibacteria group bacterium]
MLYQSLFILGRLPAIGRTELESLYGTSHFEALGDIAMAADMPTERINFARLGGSIKLGSVISTADNASWPKIQTELIRAAVSAAKDIQEGKIQLGISAYGLKVNERQLLAAGLNIKKALRSQNRSVRLVQNQEPALSSAQSLHNHLAGERGIELIVVQNGSQIVIARLTDVQNITAYASRDQNRPKRDARVGMLPPKLAQTIINLGVGQLSPDSTVLDPFCGTGVILQEALLMGYGAYGTDLEKRMINYSETNLDWLKEKYGMQTAKFQLETGDATEHTWQPLPDAIASETYLGSPLSSWPKPDKLRDIIGTCNVIIEKFLRNIGDQLPTGTRLCLAVPAWISPNGQIYHLPLLDHLEKIGYNRISFEHARPEELIYSRPGQIVGRELLVITRK